MSGMAIKRIFMKVHPNPIGNKLNREDFLPVKVGLIYRNRYIMNMSGLSNKQRLLQRYAKGAGKKYRPGAGGPWKHSRNF
jgi:hypothetical protein